jgi:uncharacterized repeat protein (TIGR04076 family)
MTIRIHVKRGECQGKTHEVGQVFTVERTTPGGMCLGAWHAISPYLMTLRLGYDLPWEKEKGVAYIHCPDPQGITLEIRRVNNES